MTRAEPRSEPQSPDRAEPCPICAAPAVARYRPFCSTRCADVDLGRWLRGGYAIAAEEEDAPDAREMAPATSLEPRAKGVDDV